MSKFSKYTSDSYQNFFDKDLSKTDPDLYNSIRLELERQQQHIELIASENIVSKAVLDAQGSVMTNKYAEGYPSKRYYGGCEFVDKAEELALERVKKLYNCKYANVQPHSGAQANGAVYLALLNPGDPILGMSLNSGGHLTHGAKVSISGKWLKSFHYDVNKETGLIDYSEVERLAKEHKPKLIIAGGSAYSRVIDFKKFREIANKVEAYLMVDMAHFSGLVAGKGYPNPIEYADVVTSTTHKVLRGGRGGIILTNREDLIKKINSAVFPGYQGGPLMHVIAAKAVCFKEAMTDDFKDYSKQIIKNAQAMCKKFIARGYDLVHPMTENHLLLLDLQKKEVNGKEAEDLLGTVNITVNKNSIPNDPESPFITSGIRIGTPAITTRGFKEKEAERVVDLMCDAIENRNDQASLDRIKDEVKDLCNNFPVYK